jgi:hypothetical protein
MLTLTLPEAGAPRWIWVPVLIAEALVRLVPKGVFQQLARGLRGATLVLATLIAIPFLVRQVREGLHPVLAAESIDLAAGGQIGDATSAFGAANNEAVTGGLQDDDKGGAPAAAAVSPAAPPPIAQELEEKARASDSLLSRAGATAPKREASKFYTETYDPNVIVQTGPGVPRWSWTSIPLSWSGPVAAGQRLKLWLLPPGVNLGLAFARLLLLALVLVRMIPVPSRLWPSGWGPKAGGLAAGVALAMSLTFAPTNAQAQMPDKATLDELRERLLAKPDCQPNCASIGRLSLQLDGSSLRGRAEIDAATATAVALPGIASQWLPDEVALDGQAAKALLRTPDGVLWMAVTAGSHQVTFSGRTPARDSLQLPLHHKPHRVEATAEGWHVAGIHEDGVADDNVQFTRIEKSTGAGGALQPGALPPFVRVERTLHIGLQWQVDTRVVRATPTGAAIVFEVPLLPGESVTTADLRVVKGAAQVNMAPDASTVEWRSTLEQKSPIKLIAPKAVAWTEVWRVEVGPMWHGAMSGIPLVHTQLAAGAAHLPEWRPWPGEEATIELTRPDGVAGQSLTIDASSLELSPGLRATDAHLSLSIRASRGAAHTITLPEGAQLESLTVGGASQPVRQEGRRVTIAIVPGAQSIELKWRQTAAIGTVFRTPEVDLGAPSVNASLKIAPGSRWVLFLGGPQMGPAVLFWSMLTVMLLIAVGLGRIRWTPLRWWHWTLLAVGLSQVPIVLGALFAGWLIALGWRKARPELADAWFNLRQVVLVGWTLVALVLLGVAIYQGLLGTPEMQVLGNGSDHGNLRWFSDRAGAVLPQASVVSLPLMAYRVAMLAWALWIAIAILRWLRFGWTAFGEGGFWKGPLPRPRHAGHVGPDGSVPGYQPAPEAASEALAAPPPPAPPADDDTPR